MANANTPRGLVPSRRVSGEMWNGQANVYYVDSGIASNIFPGDPVIPTGSSDANGIPGVTLATAGATNYLIGAMIGIVNDGQPIIPVLQNSPVYHPANTAGYILVADDPDTLFEIQENSVGGAMSADSSSSNADLVAGAGNTAYGVSGWMLDSSTVGVGATKQMRVIRLLNQPADNAIGNFAKWLVKINLHSLLNPTGI